MIVAKKAAPKGIVVMRREGSTFHWLLEESVGSLRLSGKGRVVCGRSSKRRLVRRERALLGL